MKIIMNDISYKINVIKKSNKHTYLRVDENLEINITTNKYTTEKQIKNLINENTEKIKAMINKQSRHVKNNDEIYYLGNKYDIINIPIIDNTSLTDDKIYTKDETMLNKWLNNQTKEVLTNLFNEQINKFNKQIRKPTLKLRKMSSRWGSYNKQKHTVTLNKKLINYKPDIINYVIIHEISHIIHFDHSKSFWKLVEENCNNYKDLRKELRGE